LSEYHFNRLELYRISTRRISRS